MLTLDGSPLSIDEVRRVACGPVPIGLADAARQRVETARATIDVRATGSEPVYGVNTGFGSLSGVRIEPDAVREVQRNLIRSHAAGVGDDLPPDVVRAMMVILAASLARGQSGVRPLVIDTLLALLDADITPCIPSRGSVGASGDLAPLAHLALVLIGEGEATTAGAARLDGGHALRAAGIEPLVLEAKEGLALINGTHMMTAMAALALARIDRLLSAAIGAAAMAIDASRATNAFLDSRLHAARGQPGQIDVAARLRELLAGSEIIPSHSVGDPRVQDPYSLRAAPQVLGAAMDAIAHVRRVVEIELGAVTDNPLVFDGDVVSGGNFHGMPLAISLDMLTIALCHVAGIAERRVFWLLAATDGVNPIHVYLSPQPGLHSGLMIAQYTAAACCNELQMLATPASVANIPTSAGIEDYNSMGATAAHQVFAAVERATDVIAIELLVMAEALEYQRPLRSGAGVERIYDRVRAVVPRLIADRPSSPDIAVLANSIRSGAFCPE